MCKLRNSVCGERSGLCINYGQCFPMSTYQHSVPFRRPGPCELHRHCHPVPLLVPGEYYYGSRYPVASDAAFDNNAPAF